MNLSAKASVDRRGEYFTDAEILSALSTSRDDAAEFFKTNRETVWQFEHLPDFVRCEISNAAEAAFFSTSEDYLERFAIAWVSIDEAVRLLDCSERELLNAVDDGQIDCVIDIKSAVARRRFLRILRDSIFRYAFKWKTPNDFGACVARYVSLFPTIFTPERIAKHFTCSTDHARSIAPEFCFGSSSFLRCFGSQLFAFEFQRRVL